MRARRLNSITSSASSLTTTTAAVSISVKDTYDDDTPLDQEDTFPSSKGRRWTTMRSRRRRTIGLWSLGILRCSVLLAIFYLVICILLILKISSSMIISTNTTSSIITKPFTLLCSWLFGSSNTKIMFSLSSLTRQDIIMNQPPSLREIEEAHNLIRVAATEVELLINNVNVGENKKKKDDRNDGKSIDVDIRGGDGDSGAGGDNSVSLNTNIGGNNEDDQSRSRFTVRLNTWRRNDSLIVAVRHYLSCPSVAQIQIVWCDRDEYNKVPEEILALLTATKSEVNVNNNHHPKVILERHSKNSLDERFIVPATTQMITDAILSVDDDVLRPCVALDVGFAKWYENPTRLIGYDYRLHLVNEGEYKQQQHYDEAMMEPKKSKRGIGNRTHLQQWSYGFRSVAIKTNSYSIVLTRFAFLHAVHLDLYERYAPIRIRRMIEEHKNCEDIAMSMWISALTGGIPPLLADGWAVGSQVKLEKGRDDPTVRLNDHGDVGVDGISASDNHKDYRDECVDTFATLLGLKKEEDDFNKDQNIPGNSHSNGRNTARHPLQTHPIWNVGKRSKLNRNFLLFDIGYNGASSKNAVVVDPFLLERGRNVSARAEAINMYRNWRHEFQNQARDTVQKFSFEDFVTRKVKDMQFKLIVDSGADVMHLVNIGKYSRK